MNSPEAYPRVVVDTNKILAAALKPGRVRTLLYQSPLTLISPPYILEEAEKHADELAIRLGLDSGTLMLLLSKVVSDRVKLEAPSPASAARAKAIASRFDHDDWPFIALALDYRAPIWTNDSGMIADSLAHGEYRAVDTRALEMLLEGRPWSEVEESLRGRYLYRRGRPA